MKRALLFLLLLCLCSCATPPWKTAPIIPEEVSVGVLRGPHPDFFELSKYNVGAVLCLENDLNIVYQERTQCDEHDIIFLNVPLSEYSPPSESDLRLIASLIKANQTRGITTYVHCRRGIDRTGYAIAAYRIIYEGWSFERAYKEIVDHGHSPLFYASWKSVLKKLAQEAK